MSDVVKAKKQTKRQEREAEERRALRYVREHFSADIDELIVGANVSRDTIHRLVRREKFWIGSVITKQTPLKISKLRAVVPIDKSLALWLRLLTTKSNWWWRDE